MTHHVDQRVSLDNTCMWFCVRNVLKKSWVLIEFIKLWRSPGDSQINLEDSVCENVLILQKLGRQSYVLFRFLVWELWHCMYCAIITFVLVPNARVIPLFGENGVHLLSTGSKLVKFWHKWTFNGICFLVQAEAADFWDKRGGVRIFNLGDGSEIKGNVKCAEALWNG